jgi:nitrate/nitrite-specific signal transduction histidine kinase
MLSRFLQFVRERGAEARDLISLSKSKLGSKFLSIVVVTVLLGTVLSAIFILLEQHQRLIDSAHTNTKRIGVLADASLQHAMLTNDKAMLTQMLQAIAAEMDLDHLSILDREGQVWLDSTPTGAGAPVDRGGHFAPRDLLCRVCHSDQAGQGSRAVAPLSQISGEALYTVSAIANRPECYGCHGSGSRPLGFLVFQVPLASLQDELLSSFGELVVSTSIIFFMLIGLLTPALGKFVVHPVVELARHATEIGSGNLTLPSQVKSNDEVGELARAFEIMRQHVQIAMVEKERRNRELQTLNEVARATNQLLDPQQILDLTINIAVSSLAVQAGAIYLLDHHSGRFVLQACQGVAECREMVCHLWVFNRVMGNLERPDSQVIAVPITAETCYGMWQDAQGRSFVVVPLKAKGQLLGAMTFVTHPGQGVTEEGAKTLKAIGEQVGLALANATRFQNVRNAATLEERERLAREMHDSLAQALGYLKLQASLTDDLLSSGQIVQAQANLREVREIARETYLDVREAIFGLRHLPSIEHEFFPALQEYLNEYQTHYGLQVQLLTENDCRPSFPADVSIQLTRIIQEALTNVRKHAKTSQANIRFEQIDHHWRITVEDNGTGFDPRQVPPSGQQYLGLQIMRERAGSIGGELELDSRLGSGTSVIVRVPFSDEQPYARTFAYSSGR